MLPQPFKVHFPAEASIHVQENQDVRQYEHLHFHPEMQISLILKGTGEVYYGESVEVIRQNHVLIIPSNLVHRIALEPNEESIQKPLKTHVVSIFFNLAELDETLFGLKELKAVRTFFSNVRSILRAGA